MSGQTCWTQDFVATHSSRAGEADIAIMERPGRKYPVVFLHGFGSTKEDYADGQFWPELEGHRLVAWDAPGFGRSTARNPERVDIDTLVELAEEIFRRREIGPCHLVGHSMGGLTALFLAEKLGERALSFTNIEGNLAPEDCFFSRQATARDADDAEGFVARLAEKTWHEERYGNRFYASRLASCLNPRVAPPIFLSMVEDTDHGSLCHRFTALRLPRQFMFGSQNSQLSYLPELRAAGVRLTCIEHCSHFPMYSNPVAMWRAIDGFVAEAGAQ